MDKKSFINKALNKHFDDGTNEYHSHKDIFIQRLDDIYEKEKSRLNVDNMDSILFENGIV